MWPGGASPALFDAIRGRDLEGIVTKLPNGLYEPDETTWVTIKNRAYSQAEGSAEFFEGRTLRVSSASLGR
jgi:hypothetical protein